jgi:putative transposase
LELSRYVHLNPVRVQGLGLGKAERARSRQGVNAPPTGELVRRRIGWLRGYRWSSYRAYVGLERAPAWLECGEVLALGGESEHQRRRRYREYVEEAIREGLKDAPWQSLRDQVVLGTQEFVEGLRETVRGGVGERRRLERMTKRRPDWAQEVACVEEVKGEPWSDFRERHGDGGREMVLLLARREGGLTLSELARRAGLNGDAAVAMALRRYTKRLDRDPKERSKVQKVSQLLIVRS